MFCVTCVIRLATFSIRYQLAGQTWKTSKTFKANLNKLYIEYIKHVNNNNYLAHAMLGSALAWLRLN